MALGRPAPHAPRSRRAARRAAALAAVAAAAAVGCAGGALTTRVVDSALTPAVVEPLGTPPVRTARFHVGEEAVTLWVLLADLDGPRVARVRWVDPLGRVARDSGPIPLNAEGGYRPRAGVTARMPVAGAPAALLPGTWRAELALDGRPVLEETFRLDAEDV